MSSYKVHVDARGPIFDGEAASAARYAVHQARRDLAGEGADMLRATVMDKTGRARGSFQENIHTVERDRGVVIPGPMIKGTTWAPWLEGVTRRNVDTGFKGYHLFRKTAARLRARARAVMQRRLDEVIGRMGGH